MSTVGEENARKFFADLKKNEHNMQRKINDGLAKLAKDHGYECSAEELDRVLKELWEATTRSWIAYSEPPGFAR